MITISQATRNMTSNEGWEAEVNLPKFSEEDSKGGQKKEYPKLTVETFQQKGQVGDRVTITTIGDYILPCWLLGSNGRKKAFSFSTVLT